MPELAAAPIEVLHSSGHTRAPLSKNASKKALAVAETEAAAATMRAWCLPIKMRGSPLQSPDADGVGGEKSRGEDGRGAEDSLYPRPIINDAMAAAMAAKERLAAVRASAFGKREVKCYNVSMSSARHNRSYSYSVWLWAI